MLGLWGDYGKMYNRFGKGRMTCTILKSLAEKRLRGQTGKSVNSLQCWLGVETRHSCGFRREKAPHFRLYEIYRMSSTSCPVYKHQIKTKLKTKTLISKPH